MSSYRYGRPALRASVDVQLQTAFSDGNWNSVIRLAAKRAATFKDPYYETIKICAEAQRDSTAEKCAVLVAIDELVKNKKTPDIDTIELYEWACRDFFDYEIEYADTLGPLRVRWAKANPGSPLALQCLQACLGKWDLVSAQQIATSLDKTYANTADRRYMFWNITLTFLLSISPQCTDASRKVYSLLAVRQLERAADLTENSAKLEATDRGLLTEEEVCLYYRVLRSHGTKDEFISRLKSPKLGAISQLKEGRKLLLSQGLNALETWGEWELIYTLCREALALGLEGATSPFLVCDLETWRIFAAAAGKTADSDSALSEVQAILKRYIDIKDQASKSYKKNISLALLDTTFQLPATGANANSNDGSTGLPPRVVQLGLFLDQYFDSLSAFDDVKSYVAELSFDESKALMEDVIPKLLDDNASKPRRLVLNALELRLRYLLTTCPQTLSPQTSAADGQGHDKPFQCRLCSSSATLLCECCLRKLIVDASDLYKLIAGDKELQDAIPRLDRDPRLDSALVIGTSLLKLSGLRPRTSDVVQSFWQDVDSSLFLQAVLLLDTQLKETPHDTQLRLLLVQLYLLLGCASYAYQLWLPLDVKRTIQDALSPLFFDRISTLSPGLFQGSRPLMEPLRSFYNYSLQDRSPVRIWDAFSAGSYTSILDMTEFDGNLRRSCTLMMTLVEERRAIRCFGGKIDYEIEAHPLAENIEDTTVLVDKTDYGPFPNLESAHGPPIYEFLRLGPGLSNERSHLAFLSEQYLDLLLYKPPKDYKPSKANEVALRDREYTLETLSRLSSSLTDFLHLPSTPSRLTAPETTYYTVLSLLSAALLIALSTPRSDPVPKTLSLLTKSIKTALGSLRTSVLSSSPSSTSLPPTPTTPTPTTPRKPTSQAQTQAQNQTYTPHRTWSSLADLPALSLLRDTLLATKHSASFALSLHERELARDRSGRSGLHRDALAEMRGLADLSGKGLGEVRGHVLRLKEGLAEGEGGWLDLVLDVVFPESGSEGSGGESGSGDGEGEGGEVGRAVSEVVGGRAAAEEWAGKVIESWREGVKGWGMVRME